jgi:hypothetical protein
LIKKWANFDPEELIQNDVVSHKWKCAVSCQFQKAPFGPSCNNNVSHVFQKAPFGPFGNDVISQTWSNNISLVRSSSVLDLQDDTVLSPIQPSPKWKHTAHKSILETWAQKLKAQSYSQPEPVADLDPFPSPKSDPDRDPRHLAQRAISRVKPDFFSTSPLRPNRLHQSNRLNRSNQLNRLNHPNPLNRPIPGVCIDFDRFGSFQPRFKRFQNHLKGNWTSKKTADFSQSNFQNNNMQKHWEKGESLHQGHRNVNHRFEPHVELTIPDLA